MAKKRRRSYGKKKKMNTVRLYLYLAGSIQNRYRTQKEGKKKKVFGDYGRRWRKGFEELVETVRKEFKELGIELIVIDPTKLDEKVAHSSIDRFQSLMMKYQENKDLDKLSQKFMPIWMAETKALYRFEVNERIVVITHLAETDVSGGTAIELGNIAHAGVPCYLFAPEDVVKRYRSRHVIVAIKYNGRRILRRKNVYHSAEDVMVALKKDLPRILKMNEFPAFGRIFHEMWIKKLLAARKISDKTARRLLKIRY